MSEHLQSAVQTLEENFGTTKQTFRDETTLFIQPDQIVEVCRTLRDEFEFNMVANMTAVDYWPQDDPRFHLVYQMHSLPHNVYLCLRVLVSGSQPTVVGQNHEGNGG